MIDSHAVTVEPADAVALAQAWDKQARQRPMHWHADWLAPTGWPGVPQPTSSAQRWPAWLRQRLGPAPHLSALAHPRLRPAVVPMQEAVRMLGGLALHLRPDARRRQLRHWEASDACWDSVMGGFSLARDPRAMGLLEWAALGVQDWGHRLAPGERMAYRLLRRCWPRRAFHLARHHPVEVRADGPLDWASLWHVQGASDV